MDIDKEKLYYTDIYEKTGIKSLRHLQRFNKMYLQRYYFPGTRLLFFVKPVYIFRQKINGYE